MSRVFRNFSPNKNGAPTISFIWGTATHKLRKFQSAIDTANAVLSSDASWTFGHDNSINHLDLRLLLAQGYYGLADFSASLEIVQQYFDQGFNVDVNTPEGKTDLAEKIWSLWTG